jgi:Protein of unknown function (DUF2844)
LEQSVKSLVAALTAAFFVSGSWAALGAAPEHPPARAGAAGSTGGAGYTVVQRQLDSGTTVREFVDGRGMVFAVSWSGPFLPDLKQLLGTHFDAFAARGRGQRSHRNRMAMQDAEAVIVSEGHMGAFQGRAWLPSRLPAGFDVRGMP